MDPHIEPSAELQQTVNNESDYDIVSLPASDGSDVQTADEDNLMNEKVKEDQMYDQQPLKLAFVDAAHKAAVGTYTIRSQNLEMKPSSVINYRINCKYECAQIKFRNGSISIESNIARLISIKNQNGRGSLFLWDIIIL